jgi:hypothetical protein
MLLKIRPWGFSGIVVDLWSRFQISDSKSQIPYPRLKILNRTRLRSVIGNLKSEI